MVDRQPDLAVTPKPTRFPTAAWDSAVVQLHLLGGFRIVVRNMLVANDAWRLSKSRSLVQLLALNPNHALHRDQVMELFWPDQNAKAAAANFYQIVHDARRVLSDDRSGRTRSSDTIHFRRQVVALDPPGPLWVDVVAFQEAAQIARQARTSAAYQQALELYGGDLLPEQPYDDWLLEHREALRELHLELLYELAGLYEEQGEHVSATEILKQTIDIEPTREASYAALMRLYAATGQPRLAALQYERLRQVLQEEFDAAPDAATTALQAEILAGHHRVGPQPATAMHQGNLPSPLTSFIGREAEISRLSSYLDDTRLITLTGAGGCGKSRLALELATRGRSRFEGAAWLIELAALEDPSLLLRTVATTLGLVEQHGQSVEQALVTALQPQPALLILDNCEHIAEACAALASRLLSNCPLLRILATSRERLRVDGEMVWRVPPLSLPAEETTIEHVRNSEAVRLFVARARLVQPDFELDERKAQIVAVACRRLDGMPLAIELAAARAAVMSVEQIAVRLDDVLRLLTTGSRSPFPRHETLRATLDWSYALLSEEERAALCRLGVFAGGWTVDAAEAVLSDDVVNVNQVLELLGSIAEQSLIQVELAQDPERYWLLETVRQYAREQLAARHETTALQFRHARYFAQLAVASEEGLRGADQSGWINRLDRERENLRAALTWACEHEDVGIGLDLCWGLWRYWQARGSLVEGRRWMTAVLALPAPPDEDATRAGVLFAASRFAFLQSDDLQAETLAGECLQLARRIGHPSRETGAMTLLGQIALRRGELQAAWDWHSQSLAIRRALDDTWSIGISLDCLGQVALARDGYQQARALFEESTALFRETGDSIHVANGLFHQGMVAFLEREREAAQTLLQESVEILQRTGERPRIARSLVGLAQVAVEEGDETTARLHLAEALTIAREIGARETIASCLEEYAVLASTLGRWSRAISLDAAAGALRKSVGEPAPAYLSQRLRSALEPAFARLNPSQLTAARERGRRMDINDVIGFALALEAD